MGFYKPAQAYRLPVPQVNIGQSHIPPARTKTWANYGTGPQRTWTNHAIAPTPKNLKKSSISPAPQLLPSNAIRHRLPLSNDPQATQHLAKSLFELTDARKCHTPAFCIGARSFYGADGFLGVGECSEADESARANGFVKAVGTRPCRWM